MNANDAYMETDLAAAALLGSRLKRRSRKRRGGPCASPRSETGRGYRSALDTVLGASVGVVSIADLSQELTSETVRAKAKKISETRCPSSYPTSNCT